MDETNSRESGSALDELTKDASSRKRFLSMVGGAGAAGALALFVAVLALLVGLAGVVLGWRANRRTVSS